MARWDWYQATVHSVGADEISASALRHFDLVDLAPCGPQNGYHRGAQVRRGTHVLFTIFWGGNPGVNIKSTGDDSPAVALFMRQWEHRITRADACEDWVEHGLFDRLSRSLTAYALEAGIAIENQGDWARGKARTLYLGSKDSVCRLVLYEKGAQMGLDQPWVRLEARVRPKGAAGYKVASWQPGEAFGACEWFVEALKRIGWDHLTKQSVGTVWRPSDLDRAKLQLVRQYKATIKAWKTECGDSWERLGQSFEALEQELDRGVLLH